MEKRAITVAEAAKQLGISKPTMYELTRREGFPCFRCGRTIRIPVRAFEAWLNHAGGFAGGDTIGTN